MIADDKITIKNNGLLAMNNGIGYLSLAVSQDN
jgi:hypothetical protein